MVAVRSEASEASSRLSTYHSCGLSQYIPCFHSVNTPSHHSLLPVQSQIPQTKPSPQTSTFRTLTTTTSRGICSPLAAATHYLAGLWPPVMDRCSERKGPTPVIRLLAAHLSGWIHRLHPSLRACPAPSTPHTIPQNKRCNTIAPHHLASTDIYEYSSHSQVPRWDMT